MKKKFGYILIFTVLVSTGNAQIGKGIDVTFIRLDSATQQGKAVGDKETKEIGKEGGSISSADGKLELIFPEGAVKKKKKISIQAVTNMAANGRGNAYNMEPSGLQFEKPVTIIFYYSDNEMNGTLPDFKGIASQDENGKWGLLQNVITDTVAKTITSQILHFSSYTSFDKIVLKPSTGRIKTGKTKKLYLSVATYTTKGDDGDDDLQSLPEKLRIPEAAWSVNGVLGGNTKHGWISFPSATMKSATYNAPTQLPVNNPVAVSVQLKGLSFSFNNKMFKDPTLVSNILVYDKAYKISLQMWVDNTSDGMCTMRLEDAGEFTLTMEGSQTKVKEIENRNLQIKFSPCPCAYVWTNKALVKGPFNITGKSEVQITPANPPAQPFPKIKIMLKHDTSPFPELSNKHCPGHGLPPGTQLGNMLQMLMPLYIEFEANNQQEQVITPASAFGDNKRAGVKIVIKRMEDEE